jgi:hypothetical protein
VRLADVPPEVVEVHRRCHALLRDVDRLRRDGLLHPSVCEALDALAAALAGVGAGIR